MGFLDRFKNAEPPQTNVSRGESGRAHYKGFLQYEELNQQLVGRLGFAIYDQMYRTDADVHEAVAVSTNPLVAGTWTVEPAGGEEASQDDVDVAEFVEWCLNDNMVPSLRSHFAEALPGLLRWGLCPFEMVWENSTYQGRDVIALKNLGMRLPRTIYRWIQQDGQLIRVQQLLPISRASLNAQALPNGGIAETTQPGLDGQSTLPGFLVDLPIEDLLYYRIGAEGDNWEGVSALRPVYKHWYMKDRVERVDAIAQERSAMGIPLCYPPQAAADDQLEKVEDVLANIRSNEQAYIIAPGPFAQDMQNGQGWRFEILSHDAQRQRAASDTLEYHTKKIKAAFISEFLNLGHSQTGARATANTQQQPFLNAIEGFSKLVQEVINNQLIPRIVQLNYGNSKNLPRLRMSLVDETSLMELGIYLQNLASVGAINPDKNLEAFLRQRADLPPRSGEDIDQDAAVQEPTPPNPANAAPNPMPQNAIQTPSATTVEEGASDAYTLAAQPRPMREGEEHMDTEMLSGVLDGAKARYEEAALPAVSEAAESIATSLIDKNKAGNLEPRKPLINSLAGVLQDVYHHGRRSVENEAASKDAPMQLADSPTDSGQSPPDDGQQPPQVPPATPPPTPDVAIPALAGVAGAAALGAAANGARQALVSGNNSHGTVHVAALTAARRELRRQAEAQAPAALNMGRNDAATAAGMQQAKYSAILDSGTCSTCAAADDGIWRNMDSPIRLANMPPNQDCKSMASGSNRCRCVEVYR